jgi:hypothetical protein
MNTGSLNFADEKTRGTTNGGGASGEPVMREVVQGTRGDGVSAFGPFAFTGVAAGGSAAVTKRLPLASTPILTQTAKANLENFRRVGDGQRHLTIPDVNIDRTVRPRARVMLALPSVANCRVLPLSH